MGTKKTTGTVATEYCSKYKNTPTLTLAKKMYNENKNVFSTLEMARWHIRNLRGQAGTKRRVNEKDKSNFREPFPHNVFKIPEPEEENWNPFKIPKLNNNILHIQDIHVPYHSKETIELAVEYGINKKINTLLIGYDFIDFYQMSRFEKDPRKRSVKYEVDSANQLLDYFQNKFPKAKIYWRSGNHDVRLQRYLMVKAPELLDMECLSISDMLQFPKRGITQIGDKQIVKVGKLNILHGDEFGGFGGGVNPARTAFLKGKQSVLVGHSHISSEHTETDMNGHTYTAYSVGSACGVHPNYAILNRWNNGFAHILTYPDGGFHVNNMKVIKGKIY